MFIKTLKKWFDFSQGFFTNLKVFKEIFKKSQGFAPTKLGRSAIYHLISDFHVSIRNNSGKYRAVVESEYCNSFETNNLIKSD